MAIPPQNNIPPSKSRPERGIMSREKLLEIRTIKREMEQLVKRLDRILKTESIESR